MKASAARDEAVLRFSRLICGLKRKGHVRDWPVERLEGRRVPGYRDCVLEAVELKNPDRGTRPEHQIRSCLASDIADRTSSSQSATRRDLKFMQ